MKNFVSTKFVSCLFRFVLLFKINRFTILGIADKTIKARIGWADDGSLGYHEDEEVQDIEWDIQDLDYLEDALILAEFILDNKIIQGDKITITPDEFKKKLGWEKSRYDSALKALLDIRVDMVDEGKRTDHFFVHF